MTLALFLFFLSLILTPVLVWLAFWRLSAARSTRVLGYVLSLVGLLYLTLSISKPKDWGGILDIVLCGIGAWVGSFLYLILAVRKRRNWLVASLLVAVAPFAYYYVKNILPQQRQDRQRKKFTSATSISAELGMKEGIEKCNAVEAQSKEWCVRMNVFKVLSGQASLEACKFTAEEAKKLLPHLDNHGHISRSYVECLKNNRFESLNYNDRKSICENELAKEECFLIGNFFREFNSTKECLAVFKNARYQEFCRGYVQATPTSTISTLVTTCLAGQPKNKIPYMRPPGFKDCMLGSAARTGLNKLCDELYYAENRSACAHAAEKRTFPPQLLY